MNLILYLLTNNNNNNRLLLLLNQFNNKLFLLSNNKIANGKLAAAAMNLSKSVTSSNSMVKQEKGDESLDLTVKTLMTPGDTSQSPSPPTSTSQLPFLSASILPTSSSSPLNLLVK